MTIVETEFGKIVGGFNADAWFSNSKYTTNCSDFLFSLTLREKYKCIENSHAAYGKSTHGPTFGKGHDLYLADKADEDG